MVLPIIKGDGGSHGAGECVGHGAVIWSGRGRGPIPVLYPGTAAAASAAAVMPNYTVSQSAYLKQRQFR